MAEFPALPLFTDAFLADTMHLSREEIGVYFLLLVTAWRRPNCDLPDDDAFLAKIARCDGRKWRHLRPVMATFHKVENGTWTQNRLQKERKRVGDLSKIQRENINARWSKNKDLADTAVIPNAYRLDTPIPIPIPIPIKNGSSSFNGGGAGLGNGKRDPNKVTLTNPDDRIARFQRTLAEHLGKGGWEVVAAAADPKAPDHDRCLLICRQAAQELGKGWPHAWPK